MKSNDIKQSEERKPKNRKKRTIFLWFVFGMITLFLLSFSTTTFILINSYRLTYANDNLSSLQQEIGNLKNEIARKDNEIEELKLQLANIEGESSFVNQMQNYE